MYCLVGAGSAGPQREDELAVELASVSVLGYGLCSAWGEGFGSRCSGEGISFPRRLGHTFRNADLVNLAALRAARLYHRGARSGL